MPSVVANTGDFTGKPPQALAFPRSTVAALAPRSYLLAHLNPQDPSTPSIRPDGRTPTEFRPASCNASALTHCAGSAVVRIGDTAVVCGIQAELLLASSIADPPRPGTSNEEILAHLNLLVPNVELATGCSPAHMPGGAPTNEAQTLTHRLYSLLHTSKLVDVDDLRILYTPPKMQDDQEETMLETQTVAYWTLYISIHVLSLSGSSSLIDAAWTAMLAALRDVKLPYASWNADLMAVICSDRIDQAKRLRLSTTAQCCTWGIFVAKKTDLSQAGTGAPPGCKELGDGRRAWILADPDAFEDPLCHETITIVVDAAWGRSKILRIEKSGGEVLSIGDVKGLIGAAEERWKELNAMMPR